MLTVCVYINDRPIILETAVRIATDKETGVCTYRTKEGKPIRHNFYDGAEILAIQLLHRSKKWREANDEKSG